MTNITNGELFLAVVQDKVWDDFLVPLGCTKTKAPVSVEFLIQGDPTILGRTRHYRFETTPEGYAKPSDIEICSACHENNNVVWAAATLAHELAHYAVPMPMKDVDSHALPGFVAAVTRMGLVGPEGPAVASEPSPEFRQWVLDVVIPEYERRAATVSSDLREQADPQ